MRCVVKTRYRQEDIPCTVTPLGDDKIGVRFITVGCCSHPGQSAVFYRDEVCAGGGSLKARITE